MNIEIGSHAEGIGQVRVVTVTTPRGQRQVAFAAGEIRDWQTVVRRCDRLGIDVRDVGRDQEWWQRRVERALA